MEGVAQYFIIGGIKGIESGVILFSEGLDIGTVNEKSISSKMHNVHIKNTNPIFVFGFVIFEVHLNH